jgi:integrase
VGGDNGPQPTTTTSRPLTLTTLPPQLGQAGDTLLGQTTNNNTNTHTSADPPRTTLPAHRGGSAADNDRDMNNNELDCALARLIPNVTALPATCTIDICNPNTPLATALSTRGGTTILLPMWFRHHWVLGALRGNTLDVWDSAPSPLVKDDILAFASTLAQRLGVSLRVRGRATARQPWGTRQCGTHAIVRAVLLSLDLNCALPAETVVDFGLLRGILPTSPSTTTLPIAALLASVSHPNHIDAAANNNHIPPFQAASIRECLRPSKEKNLFLLAYHTSPGALPNDWLWGLATVLRVSYASTQVSWKALTPDAAAKTLTLPSSELHIFALAAIKPASVEWDRHTPAAINDTASPSRTLRVNSPSYSQVAASIPRVSSPSLTRFESTTRDSSPAPARLGSTPPATVVARSLSHVSATPTTEVRHAPLPPPTPTVRVGVPPSSMSPLPPPVTTTARTTATRAAAQSATTFLARSPVTGAPTPSVPVAPTPPATAIRQLDQALTLLSSRVLDIADCFPHKHPSQFKGRDLTGLEILDAGNPDIPPLALKAIQKETAAAHRGLLKKCASLPRDLHNAPLDEALLEWLCRERQRLNWTYSTLSTKMASLAGALRLLPLYTRGHPSIHMAASVIWSQASKACGQLEKLTPPKRAAPASWADVEAILLREHHSKASLAVLLAWITCGRVADVLRLRPHEVSVGTARITITFRDNKTRSTYTVVTAVPPSPHLGKLAATIEAGRLDRAIFHDVQSTSVARAMKAQKDTLTQHSLRRGALQTLANSGVPVKDLMFFSGHKTVESLMSYLDDGVAAPGMAEHAAQAAVLVGGGVDESFNPAPCPSYHETQTCFPPKHNTRASPRPPLHMKPVSHMSMEKLLQLDMGDDTRAYLLQALRWTQDASIYQNAIEEGRSTRLGFKAPSFTDHEMEQMAASKFGPHKRTPGCKTFPVFGFPVLQQKAGKDVIRPIWEPAINDAIGDHAAQPLHLPRRHTVLEHSTPSSRLAHIWCQLDGVSCFDQVPLAPEVRHFFTFVWDGQLQSLLSLPMGFRRAVELACAILWALLDFPRPSEVRVDSYVDNVRFGGPTGPTADAVITFVARAQFCNYQLDHTPTTHQQVLAISPRVDTFLGVEYDYDAQTRRLPQKAINKLRLVQHAPATLTHRQLACLVGLATWTGAILDFSWPKCWHLFRRYASCAIAWTPSASITLSAVEHSELHNIIHYCLRNKPVAILAPPPPPVDMVLMTDASKTGWGALGGRPGDAPTTFSGQWAKFIGSSVLAEPEGAWAALQALGAAHRPQHVRLLTDHQPLVFAAAKKRATAWAYNALLARLATLPFHVSLGFIPGSANPADAPSRGVAITPADIAAFQRHVPTVASSPSSNIPRFMT